MVPSFMNVTNATGKAWNYLSNVHSCTFNPCSNAGVSRSSTVALAYVMETERIPLEHAYERLKLSRPAVQPNPGFMSQLAAFQKQLGIDSE